MSTKPILQTNPRGIPQAPFIDNVEEHVGGPDAEVESALRQFQEAIAKYRYMELNLNTRKKALLDKIPDIEKTLAMVQFLKDKREGKLKAKTDEDLEDDDDESSGAASSSQTLTFELNDTLYAEAEVNTTEDIVYLWLGANVMLSYTQEEAVKLLTEKLTAAKQSLSNATEDLEFLREQITIMEVNTARCYNWDVKRRREKRLAGEATEGSSKA